MSWTFHSQKKKKKKNHWCTHLCYALVKCKPKEIRGYFVVIRERNKLEYVYYEKKMKKNWKIPKNSILHKRKVQREKLQKKNFLCFWFLHQIYFQRFKILFFLVLGKLWKEKEEKEHKGPKKKMLGRFDGHCLKKIPLSFSLAKNGYISRRWYDPESREKVTLPGYGAPVAVGDEFYQRQKIGWEERNREFRKKILARRRHIANELLFGRDACLMLNKMQQGGNQKALQNHLVNNLYALKLKRFKLEFLDDSKRGLAKDAQKRHKRIIEPTTAKKAIETTTTKKIITNPINPDETNPINPDKTTPPPTPTPTEEIK
ncbi:hypothetical protein RFI_04162 [Reticulomyxa filosa]|uniref:Uncharacterized protein n=1 Tax=Reticulomyxa filosa TaxID=46433 RepID=X6P335_RETFI|nr:hypothetical protein RFI_04162 [Reticulomyxa filosa]|eukprot:ETO32945.1 hypothetical protein RFI_04162 [Reticulomyxa filosa]